MIQKFTNFALYLQLSLANILTNDIIRASNFDIIKNTFFNANIK